MPIIDIVSGRFLYFLVCLSQVTPLVTKDEYRERRASVVRAADKLVGGSQAVLVIVVSAAKRYMSEKIPHVYRQNSDFFYLTGCTEPDAVLVLASKPGGGSFEEVLFYPRSDLQVDLIILCIVFTYAHNSIYFFD